MEQLLNETDKRTEVSHLTGSRFFMLLNLIYDAIAQDHTRVNYKKITLGNE